MFAGELGQHARLEDGMRQRLLAVDMFAKADGHRRGRGVGVVGSGDGHGVDALGLLFQHLPEVGILGRLRVAVEHVRRTAGIDVAKCHDVLAFAAVDVDLSLAAGTDRRNVKPFVCAEHTARHHHREDDRAGGSHSGLQKISAPNGGNLWSCHKPIG